MGFFGFHPVGIANIELAEKILATTGWCSKLNDKTLLADDPKQRQPIIGLARGTLGWEPPAPRGQDPDKTITSFRPDAQRYCERA
jgi:UDP-glucuronate decarboxylase